MSEAVGSGIGIGDPSSWIGSSRGIPSESNGKEGSNPSGTVNNSSTFDQGNSSFEA